MRSAALAAVFLACCASGAFAADPPAAEGRAVERIAFGSCCRQDRPCPIFDAIADGKPDLFVMLGDNIYGDTDDPAVLREKWATLDAIPAFARLRSETTLLATWDDHDYGANDAGADFPVKEESQRAFLDWLNEPADSPRRATPGVYAARDFGPPGRRVQVILLDTRTFRSPLVPRPVEPHASFGIEGPYAPNRDPAATVLGETQWEWLEERLREPAEVRLIASSVQAVADEHFWERWGAFPAERERLFRLIGETRAGGVILLSGDRHTAEISRLENSPAGYPLYDLTASSFNQPAAWKNERNRHRVGSLYGGTNYGTIAIDWGREGDPRLTPEIRDENGRPVLADTVRLGELQPPPAAP